jgi:hypothetical protein
LTCWIIAPVAVEIESNGARNPLCLIGRGVDEFSDNQRLTKDQEAERRPSQLLARQAASELQDLGL